MKRSMLDTDILSLFLRNDENVKKNLEQYLLEFTRPSFSILTFYEISSGLKYRDSKKQIDRFLEFANYCEIINLSIESINHSANIYANLRKKGRMIDDVDILIAGICLADNFVLITNNEKHYSNIEELNIVNWSK